ncbi:long-chain fatty acid--CoA ligase [Trinickia violacea]|uniref:Long-chain fatty acid--CoA ligase n=1 Tax=Trinickia violacea TaxID=2571746 RepID=A0A4P8J290_9BURK|nr:long-chain fatty acid--CoA ligase [Trinickia violacea]QCP55111.1 long-chain fatty acid--CoA ligase [Trinickia violacea]
MRHTMMDFPLTIGGILAHAAKVYGGTEIVSYMPDCSTHRYCVADLASRVARLAGALRELGLQPGDRVATLMWNHYAHLETYFAVPAAGGVLNTLNLRLAPDDIVYIANHAGARFLIVDDDLMPLYERIRARTSFERVIVVPLGGVSAPDAFSDYEHLIAVSNPFANGEPIDENAPVSVCYTSGTTGRPKGVVYSHRALVLHTFCISLPDVFDLSMRKTLALVVPMFHVNGWCLPFAALLTGVRLVLPGPHLDAESLFKLLADEQVILSAGVPSLWHGLIDKLQASPELRAQLSPALHLVVAGSACPESMMVALDRLSIRATHAWGMTELSPVGAFSTLKPHLAQAGSADADQALRYRMKQGLPLPFVEARIMTEQGTARWDGESVGELQVRGPWVAAGYYGDVLPDSWSDDGWLRTGDAAHIDAEGYIQITDRLKDLIKSGGEWISSVALENALMGHEAVKEAAVVAMPDPRWQERPLAFVQLRAGHHAMADDLISHLSTHFTRWWLPDAVEFVDEIPKTSTGKIQKSVLRTRAAELRSRLT